MALADRIHEQVRSLPAELQSEVLEFVQFLVAKARLARQEGRPDDWHEGSLAEAMRGMEDEGPDYSMADVVREAP